MSVRNDSPGVPPRRVVNKLLELLRDKLQPSKKYDEKVKKQKYKPINAFWACEALEGIPVEKFDNYVEELQERHSLPDKAKKSFLDALIANEKHGSADDFNLSDDGKITMFSLECITMKKNEKMIDLAFAMYNLSFKLDNEEGTSSNQKSFSMNKKDAFRKMYQEKLFDFVDQKCKVDRKCKS